MNVYKFFGVASCVAGLSASTMAHADNGTWTMPYGGSCTVAGPCFNVVNDGTGGSSAVGVQGWSDVGSTGVFGHSGSGYGVQGQSSSSYGVYADSGGSHGVYATTASATAAGVLGQNLNGGGYGVWGYTNGGGYGVYGQNPGSGYAVFAEGRAGGTGNWINASDARLKKDVTDARYGLNEVLQLRPITYKLKEGDGQTHVGFIAQEVQKLVPEVVSPLNSMGMLGVEYSSLVPVLAKAVQEQQKLIEHQQAEIAALQRARSAVSSYFVPSGAIALGLVPLGFIAVRRRREERAT
jgi:hypothetical protein